MMNRFALLILLTLFPWPAVAQDAAQPSGAISTTQDNGGDAAIETRIEGIIAELDGYADIAVDVREGIVTFSGEVLDAEAIPRLEELAARVNGVVAIENDVTESTDVARRLDPVADRFAERARQFVNYLPLLTVAVLAGALVIVAGILLARWDAPWRRLAPNAFIADIYRLLLRLAFVVAGIVVALDILNATALLTGLLGAAGIVGLAVGFAVRDTVENFIASVMLSLRQPFRPNDVVDIEGSLGSVIRLTSRATILLDPDGNHLRLPNSFVFKAKILNYTRNAERRFGFVLGVDPNDDLAQAKRIGLDTIAGLDFVLADPPPQVWQGCGRQHRRAGILWLAEPAGHELCRRAGRGDPAGDGGADAGGDRDAGTDVPAQHRRRRAAGAGSARCAGPPRRSGRDRSGPRRRPADAPRRRGCRRRPHDGAHGRRRAADRRGG